MKEIKQMQFETLFDTLVFTLFCGPAIVGSLMALTRKVKRTGDTSIRCYRIGPLKRMTFE